MSRSGYLGYLDEDDIGTHNRYRANVNRALAGRRGQAFLRELGAALDAMPVKELIAGELVRNGAHAGQPGTVQVCAIGAVAVARGVDVSDLDPGEVDDVAKVFGLSPSMVREIVYENDEMGATTSEGRWQRMRAWVTKHLRTEAP